ncbi:MAG: SH3 domain-containing protein [Chloroflexi bacterium]|nr:SH3 domain-containing protein [Chloroflexota bacterium]
MRYRIAVFVLVIMGVLSGCNLSASGGAQTAPTPTGSSSGGSPIVKILSPQDGAQVPVNQQILVSANANDPVGITRVQLFANDQIAKTVSSQTPGGDTNLNVLLDYTPTTGGSVVLKVIAYRGALASEPDQITVNVVTVTPTQSSGGGSVIVTQQPPVIIVPPINNNDPTCRVLVNTALNLRSGPGINYNIISLLATGTVAPITGRVGDNSWYQIRVGVTTGWVSSAYVTLYGNCQNVGIPPIPPTPTPHYTPTSFPTSTLTTTPQPPTSTPPPGLPDLVVTNLTLVGDPLALNGGANVTGLFSVTVTNTGASPTTQFNNIINVSPPGTDTPLGVVASLNPGESIVLNINITFTAAGDYNLIVTSDSDSQITEVSEVNNKAYLTLTVGP